MGMYRVLIVDDEPEIRMGHRLKVEWEELGMVVSGEASNGIEALELLASEPFDIVMVDMNMPVMGGVSLLDACYERYPQLRLLVITGYEDFQYAKAAIRSEARDYLLKPVSRDELTASLRKMAQQLDEERRALGERQTAQWRLSEYYKEMKEHFILHIVKEPLEQERVVRDRAKPFELEDWDSRAVRFLTAGLRERPENPEAQHSIVSQMRLPFELICREFAAAYPVTVHAYRDAHYSGLMHFIMQDSERDIRSFIDELRDCVASRVRMEPLIGIGEPALGFQAWRAGSLSSLLAWSLAEGGARQKTEVTLQGKALLSEDTMKLLQRLLDRGELETFEQTVRQELARVLMESKSQYVKLIFQLYLLLDSLAHESGTKLDSGDQLWLRPELVLELDTVDKAAGFLVRLGRSIHQQAGAGAADSERSLIEAAKQYIQDHYMVDINLTVLAERFKYNASYFSELFKSKAGTTFIQFLTEVRMSQAVRLLKETELNLWDIAELTGFSNASYFSSKFKRMYSVSPSEFRLQSPKKIDTELPKK